MNLLQMLLIVLIAFIAGMGSILDELQTHRPLIVCTLAGIVMGDMTTGIILGGSLELIALGWMNIGAALAPDAAMASIVSSILVIGNGLPIQEGVAIAIPIAAAGQVLTMIVRTITTALSHRADTYGETGNLRGIEMMHLLGLSMQGLRVAIPTALVLALPTSAVNAVFNAIPDVLTNGLSVAGGFIVVVGYAMVINTIVSPHLMPFLFLGFVIAAVPEFTLIGLGILGIVTAVIYIALSPRYAHGSAVAAGKTSEAEYNADYDEFDSELEDL